MKTIFSALFLISLAVLTSCQKDKLPLNPAPGAEPSVKINTINAKSGKYINPFENLGVLHNEALDYVTHTSGFTGLNSQQLYDAVYPFNYSHFQARKMNPQENQDFCVQINNLVNADKMAPVLLLKQGRISAQLKGLLDELFSILSPAAGTVTPVSPAAVSTQVLEFEQSIVSSYGMPSGVLNPNTDIGAILADAAVARHSYQYWYDAFTNSANPWYARLNLGNVSGEKVEITWQHFWNKVKSDFIGFWDSSCLSPYTIDLGCAIGDAINASAEA